MMRQPVYEAPTRPPVLESAITPDGELRIGTEAGSHEEGLLVPLAFAPLAILVGVRPHRYPRSRRTQKGGAA